MTERELILEAYAARQKPKRRRQPETDILGACLDLCRLHRAVAWAERLNSGAGMVRGQWVEWGWPGAPDIIGQLRAPGGAKPNDFHSPMAGRMFLCEVKTRRGALSGDQRKVLVHAGDEGALCCVARDVLALQRLLDRYWAGEYPHGGYVFDLKRRRSSSP